MKVPPIPPHVLMNFRGFPPGCGDSVADFWGWDAHEGRLGDYVVPDVSGDMQEDEIPGGTLSLNLLTTQRMVTTGFPARKNSHGRTGNRTRDLMISSQRPWSLDHEAGQRLWKSVYRRSLLYSTSIDRNLRYANTNFGVQTMAAISRRWCYLTVLI